QPGIGVDRFAEGVVAAEEETIRDALADRESAGVVAGVLREAIIFDIAVAAVRTRGQSGSADFLVDVVFPSQVSSLGSGVAGFQHNAAAHLTLDGKVPAL